MDGGNSSAEQIGAESSIDHRPLSDAKLMVLLCLQFSRLDEMRPMPVNVRLRCCKDATIAAMFPLNEHVGATGQSPLRW